MNFGYGDLVDLTLTHQSGRRLAAPIPGPSETTFTINAGLESDGLGLTVNVQAIVHAPGNRDNAQYEGVAEFHANFFGPIDPDQHPRAIELLWPYLRSALLEQAARLGFAITVPLDAPRAPEQ